jgi:hypothetical protein
MVKVKTWTRALLIILALSVMYGMYSYYREQGNPEYAKNIPTPTPITTASGNIVIFSPTSDSGVSQDFQISGKARVFENVVSLRIKKKITGTIYTQAAFMANAKDAGVFGDFVYDAHLKADNSLRPGDTLILEVFQASPKDGSETDKVSIPIIFTPTM